MADSSKSQQVQSSLCTLDIRKAVVADAGHMKACVENAYQHYIERIGKPPGPMLDDYAEIISKHQAYVAELEERLAGIIVLIKAGNGILLDNIAVDPTFQGQGIGGKLLAFAEDRARQQGYQKLELYTHELMVENIEAYLKLGYVEVERRQVKGYARIYMQKTLI